MTLFSCTLLFVGCAGPAAPTNSQRPLFSQSTRTTAPGTLELESGVSVDPDDRAETPMTLKIGMSENSELFVGFSPFKWEERSDESDGHGIGDTVVGVRERVLDFGPKEPAIAYQLKTKIPTASARQGLGTEEFDFFAALMLEMPYGDGHIVGFYQLGLLGDPGGTDPNVQHGLALAGRLPLDGGLGFFAELAGIVTPEVDDEELQLTTGGSYAFSEGVSIDAGMKFGLTEDAPDFELLFGVVVNLGGIGTD